MRTVTAIITNEGVKVALGCNEDDLEKAAIAVLAAALVDLSEPYGTGEERLAAAEEIGARIVRVVGENLEKVISRAE